LSNGLSGDLLNPRQFDVREFPFADRDRLERSLAKTSGTPNLVLTDAKLAKTG
jgi:hypothetical protein